MTKKLLFALLLGLFVSGASMLQAYAGGQDDQGENDDDQGLPIVVCPPGGCIQ